MRNSRFDEITRSKGNCSQIGHCSLEFLDDVGIADIEYFRSEYSSIIIDFLDCHLVLERSDL